MSTKGRGTQAPSFLRLRDCGNKVGFRECFVARQDNFTAVSGFDKDFPLLIDSFLCSVLALSLKYCREILTFFSDSMIAKRVFFKGELRWLTVKNCTSGTCLTI